MFVTHFSLDGHPIGTAEKSVAFDGRLFRVLRNRKLSGRLLGRHVEVVGRRAGIFVNRRAHPSNGRALAGRSKFDSTVDARRADFFRTCLRYFPV